MTFSKNPRLHFFLAFACTTALAACGGAAVGTSGAVSGILSGLGAGLQTTLQNNGGDNVVVTADGTFVFPTQLPSLGPFSVTVLSQPTNQFCTVTRPTGVIPTDGNKADVTRIVCAANSLGATVTGLAAGNSVTLANGAGVAASLTATANGLATFSGILAGGATYAVSVTTQPTGQVCTVTNASGSITSGVQSLVGLNCV